MGVRLKRRRGRERDEDLRAGYCAMLFALGACGLGKLPRALGLGFALGSQQRDTKKCQLPPSFSTDATLKYW